MLIALLLKKSWRARYGILTTFAPLLVMLAAHAWSGLLRGLLLLRIVPIDDAASDPTHGDILPSLLLRDLVALTWMSAMVVALGLAIVRIIDLHSETRMQRDPEQDASELDEQQSSVTGEPSKFIGYLVPTRKATGWSLLPTLLWISTSLTYPIAAAHETLKDQRAIGVPPEVIAELRNSAKIGIAVGMLVAIAVLVFFGVLRALLMGPQTASSGLFFGEGIANWLVQLTGRKLSTEQRPAGICLWVYVAGLTDWKTRKLLPGHPQLFVALFVSSAVYATWYLISINSETWNPHGWPVGFYLLLLIYCSSAIFSFLTFFLDRYHIPVLLVTVLYLGLFSDAHRYFELTPDSQSFQIERPTADLDHVLVKALAERPTDHAAYATPPPLKEVFGNEFHFPKWPGRDGKRTMVVVTASGGGIQAAGWTARVLSGLDERIPVLTESIGLISSVSGGSVGTMYYLAHRGKRLNDPDAKSWTAAPAERLERIRSHSIASSMEAIGWGVAFPDFVRSVMPFHLHQDKDRGWALEAAWWNRLGPTSDHAKWMKEIRIRDLTGPTVRGEIPAVIFNATAVETGQRVLISPIRTTSGKSEYDSIDKPIDFLDFYGNHFADQNQVNPRLTAAVRLSAAFAYVTPVARPLPTDKAPNSDRLAMHLCDGGYADNTGLVTAIGIVQDLISTYEKRMKETGEPPPFERVIFVRIEPFPPQSTTIVRDNSGVKSALLGPLTALAATRSSTQAERANLELSLLMGLNRAEFSTAQTSLPGELASRMVELREAASETEEQLQDSKFDRLRREVKKLANQPLPKSESEELDIQRQVGVVAKTVERMQASSDPLLARINKAISSYKQAVEDKETQAAVTKIEVKTALFLFDPRRPVGDNEVVLSTDERTAESLTNASVQIESEAARRPPLSWLLAETDIDAIERAWSRYESKFDAKEEVATAAIETSQQIPWVPADSGEFQQNLLSPSDLQSLGKSDAR